MSTTNTKKDEQQLAFANEEIDKNFKSAFKAHQSNNFVVARKYYEKVLQLHPSHIKTLYLFGCLCCQTKEFAEGIEYLDKVILLSPEHAEAYSSRGNALNQLLRYDEALLCYVKATKINPKYADAFHNQGITLVNLKRPKEAIVSFEQAIYLNPSYAMAYFEKGIVELSIHLYEKAVASFKQTLVLLPSHVEATSYLEYSEKGLLRSKRDPDDKHISAIDDDSSSQSLKALLDNGEISAKLNLTELSLSYYREAVKRFPDSAKAHLRCGITLKDNQVYDEALICLNHAVKLNPTDTKALSHRGEVFTRLNRPQEARADFESCLALDVNSHDYYYYHVAFANRCMGLYDTALENYRLWLRVGGNKRNDSDRNSVDFAESLIWLVKGCYTLGWQLYEARWLTMCKLYFRNFKQILWLGDFDISNKHILIHAEQGLGDALQMFRYVELVADKAAKVTLEMHAPLVSLLKNNTKINVIPTSNLLPDFDVQCPMMSLPLAFKTKLDNIPNLTKPISADAETRKNWTNKINAIPTLKPSAFNIGFVVSGNPKHLGDTARSISLQQMLAYLPNEYNLFSLQKEFRAEDSQYLDKHSDIYHFENELEDFNETAAYIACMDVVISVDTSVAHLAASMGKPTWILLPFSPDFRWLLDRDDSPWYPSAKLYRQTDLNDWDSVLAKVKADLKTLKPA